MGMMASQITSLVIVYSTIYSGADQRKHQSSASLAFMRGIHQWLVNSPHKGPVTRKVFPFDDVIMFEGFNAEWQQVIFTHKIDLPMININIFCENRVAQHIKVLKLCIW